MLKCFNCCCCCCLFICYWKKQISLYPSASSSLPSWYYRHGWVGIKHHTWSSYSSTCLSVSGVHSRWVCSVNFSAACCSLWDVTQSRYVCHVTVAAATVGTVSLSDLKTIGPLHVVHFSLQPTASAWVWPLDPAAAIASGSIPLLSAAQNSLQLWACAEKPFARSGGVFVTTRRQHSFGLFHCCFGVLQVRVTMVYDNCNSIPPSTSSSTYRKRKNA